MRTLIVLPASLLHQWQGEITSKFARDSFKYHVYHEANRKKHAYNLEDNDIVFTTYEIISREMDIFDKDGNPAPTVSNFYFITVLMTDLSVLNRYIKNVVKNLQNFKFERNFGFQLCLYRVYTGFNLRTGRTVFLKFTNLSIVL